MTGLEVTPGAWLIVVGLGTLLGLDAIAWPQTMASRPVVAGTIGGTLFGDPASGFLAGAWLEIVFARHPPYGAARYPETGPSGLVAGAAFALSDTGSALALLTAVVAGWTLGWIGTHSIAVLRRYSGELVGDPVAFHGDPGELARRHLRAIRLDAARAAALTGAMFLPVALSVRWLETWPAGELGTSATPFLAVLGLAALSGVGARVLGGRREGWPPFALGGLAGLLLLWIVG